MAIVYADRVKETTTTTGTGTITLAGAVTGFQAFGDELANAEQTYYTIETADLSAWEVGIGTYTTSGTTLSRDTIITSSTGSAVSFGAGTKTVFATIAKQAFDGLARPGDIKMIGFATPDPGWLACDGAAVSRTTYAALFAKISTTFGVGNGTTTFNMPNLIGKFPIGAETTTDHDLGESGGAATVTLTEAQLPAHSHSLNGSDAFDDQTSLAGNFFTAYDGTTGTPLSNTTNGVAANAGSIGTTGSGTAHENRPPFLAVNFVIKT